VKYEQACLSLSACHLPGDSDLLTGDNLAARWLTVDCAAPSRPAADILALILEVARRFRRSWLTYQEAQSGGRRRSIPAESRGDGSLRFLRCPRRESLTPTCKNPAVRGALERGVDAARWRTEKNRKETASARFRDGF